MMKMDWKWNLLKKKKIKRVFGQKWTDWLKKMFNLRGKKQNNFQGKSGKILKKKQFMGQKWTE